MEILMKPLKLKWKRVSNPQEKYEAKAAYEARGAQKIGVSKVAYRALAVNRLERAKGTSPWMVAIDVAGERIQHLGKTFKEVKDLAAQEIEEGLGIMEKQAAERAGLIEQIKAIYKVHDQKARAGFEGHTTENLKKHLAALQAGNFPWKMPPRGGRRERPSKDSPAAGAVVRIPVSESTRDLALREVKHALERRVQQKGDGAFVSIHELRGALDEEWDELTDAMHSKDLGRIEAELIDWIVGGVFGLACIRAVVLK